MTESIRGFNFIEDFTKALPYRNEFSKDCDEDILREIRALADSKAKFKHTFDNCELEMKRFIAWFYTAEYTRYDKIVEADTSGFLADCIKLYDPKTQKYPAPFGCFDYSCNFD